MKIISKTESSELTKFASWFHQDWKYIFEDFHRGAEMYFYNLSPQNKTILKNELLKFIEKHVNSSDKVLKKACLKLGAQSWQSNLNVKNTLKEFTEML